MNATLARLSRLAVDLYWEPDALLIDRFLAGSEPAFRELLSRHGPLVYAVCKRILRHHQDAEDAFQAVFLVLARRAADVWPREAVGAWLYGVAHRVALKARALRARRASCECPLQDVPGSEPPRPEPDAVEIIDRVVRKLPAVYRAAVIACDLEGLSRKDAAGQLGWKEGTLSGRLARARKLLANRLRQSGLTLPAGGLAAVLGTDVPVRAGLDATTVRLVVTREVLAVPAPIAALTEGMVRTMFAMKFKMMAAAVLVAGAVGYSAWAGGPADGVGGGSALALAQPPAAAEPPADPNLPDLSAARKEIGRLERELAAMLADSKANPVGQSAKDVATRIIQLQSRLDVAQQLLNLAQSEFARAGAAGPGGKVKRPAALESLRGNWRIVTLVEDGKAVPPPKFGFGTIEISGSSLSMPYLEGGKEQKRQEFSIAVDDRKQPRAIDLIASGKPVGRGIYEFTAAAMTCASCHTADGLGVGPFGLKPPADLIGLCGPGIKKGTGLRLAIALEGPRPTAFGGDKVLVFNLERAATDTDRSDRDNLARRRAQLEAYLKWMGQTDAQKAEVAYQLAQMRVEEAKRNQETARAKVDLAQAQVEQAIQEFTVASRNVQAALEKVAAAEKSAKKGPIAAGKNAKATCTIHIRPLAAGETVRWVMTDEIKTVLEGLALAAADLPFEPGSVDIWLVRGQKVLPIDYTAIARKADLKTNYTLQAGDQLFVQMKVAK